MLFFSTEPSISTVYRILIAGQSELLYAATSASYTLHLIDLVLLISHGMRIQCRLHGNKFALQYARSTRDRCDRSS
jgi:hypothetical protein